MRKLIASKNRASSRCARIRDNMTHQLSAILNKTYQTICIEDLSVQKMTATGAGTAEEPGKDVKKKARRNRLLLNVAPYRVKAQLSYKTDKTGGSLVVVPPQYTSQTCSAPGCGYTDPANRAAGLFHCLRCGHIEHADVNAAKNILTKGKATNTPDGAMGKMRESTEQ